VIGGEPTPNHCQTTSRLETVDYGKLTGMMSLAWEQVLAWRMHRQLLAEPGDATAVEVVRRLAGVQAQMASAAELGIAVRQAQPRAGEVAQALWEDRALVKTWAMRGTLHLLPADDAGSYLSLMGAVRFWERPSWQKAFGASPADVAALTDAVAEILDGRVLTREELVADVVKRTGSTHLEELLRSGWGTLLKPVAWQGFLCQGPSSGTRVTFTRPDSWSPAWRGVPRPDEAAPTVIRAFLGAHGPATIDAFDAWLTRSTSSKRTLRRWFADLGDELAMVDVEGTQAYVLAADVDELAAQRSSRIVRLLPGFDQYVLGAGTGDPHVVPPDHRSEISRTAGWISPVVLAGGRVAGVWDMADGAVNVTLFDKVARKALAAEVARLGRILGRDLSLIWPA
jgi:hypothetical protein